MAVPQVSVVLCEDRYLDTLLEQECDEVQLILCDDAGWGEDAADRARERDWQVVRAGDRAAAVTASSAEFIVEWTVFEGTSDALASLVGAAVVNPDKQGAISANFDPLVLWRRDELVGRARREGLAQASGVALNHGGSISPLWWSALDNRSRYSHSRLEE